MKLYFYHLVSRFEKTGIFCKVCEVKETEKTYRSLDNRSFPTYTVTYRKDCIGRYDQGYVVLTEPNMTMAKEILTKRQNSIIADLKFRLETEQRKLKIIEESED